MDVSLEEDIKTDQGGGLKLGREIHAGARGLLQQWKTRSPHPKRKGPWKGVRERDQMKEREVGQLEGGKERGSTRTRSHGAFKTGCDGPLFLGLRRSSS